MWAVYKDQVFFVSRGPAHLHGDVPEGFGGLVCLCFFFQQLRQVYGEQPGVVHFGLISKRTVLFPREA
jgi:hypothetical protein